jgi:hydroxymethylbilane synthase
MTVTHVNKLSLVAGTRGSALALAQTQSVVDLLQRKNKRKGLSLSIVTKVIKTSGDDLYRKKKIRTRELTGKDSFTREIDLALMRGDIDFAVHSLKDVPVEKSTALHHDQLEIGAFPKRERPYDVLISRNPRIKRIEDLPENARIGTSSLRRGIQLKLFRPDLEIVEIHGNVPTRIKKMQEGKKNEERQANHDLDAVILAEAGLRRLKIKYDRRSVVPSGIILPAVGQGCLAVMVRSNDYRIKRIIKLIDDKRTRLCVTAERSFSKELGGGCNTPIAALAKITKDSIEKQKITLVGLVAGESKSKPSGTKSNFVIRDAIEGNPKDARKLGTKLARKLKAMLK